jgi:type I restriction enzyme S subunit
MKIEGRRNRRCCFWNSSNKSYNLILYFVTIIVLEAAGICSTGFAVIKDPKIIRFMFALFNEHSNAITEILLFLFISNYPLSIVKELNNRVTGKNLKIPLPPTLTEQRAIATVLSDTDALLQALEKKIAKKKLIKKGVMQELLTPKEGWVRVKLDDEIDVNRGGSPRPIQDYITGSPNGINWIKIGDTSSNSKYITSAKEKIIEEGAQNSRRVNIGDFLLSNSMSFGRPYILKINGCIHDGWLVLQNYQESFDREFLYYTLMSEDVFKQYLSKASGSGVLNLNKELVKTVELNKPKDIREQVRIATVLSDMDKEIENLEQKLSKYQLAKQGMMQQLLTGKIRLV